MVSAFQFPEMVLKGLIHEVERLLLQVVFFPEEIFEFELADRFNKDFVIAPVHKVQAYDAREDKGFIVSV